MTRLLLIGTVLALICLCTLALTSCESPAAQRERARAERVRAEAQAYQLEVQANTQAASERAAIRQMERDAAHQRALEMIPIIMVIGCMTMVTLLATMLLLERRRHRVDPFLLAYLEHQGRIERGQTQELWHAIASLSRLNLPPESESQTDDTYLYLPH